MADTRQCVFWSLERSCALRSGKDWMFPIQTQQQLYQIQRCSEELQKNVPQVCRGIWVTSQYWGSDADGNTVYIPSSGIRIDEIAAPFGGWSAVRDICADCEANVATPESGVGWCFGTIEVMYPGSDRFDELLWKVIDRFSLESDLRSAFQITDPLWFGFWIDSPLNRNQCQCLLDLLPRALPLLWEKDPADPASEPVFGDIQFAFSDFDPAESYGRQYVAFFRALQTSIKWDLPLHVHVPPPGHTDFGMYTVFAHCPHCKCAADVPRWQEVESQDDYECRVCGHRFDPASTYRSERDDDDHELGSLERMLGDDYDRFVIEYGQTLGHTRKQMMDALDIHREGPLKRQVCEARKQATKTRDKFQTKALRERFDELPGEIILELGNGVVMEFVLIPAGKYQMGETRPLATLTGVGDQKDDSSSGKDEQLMPDSLPIHSVTFAQPFYLAKFPVTQSQWRAITGGNPSKCRDPRRPVEQVDWLTAQSYCAQISQRLGRHLRLPSEAEWEYACRAGTTTPTYTGNQMTETDANLDHATDSLEDYFSCPKERNEETTPVDQYPPNPWGLYDMIGNVNEWCDDSWHANYDGAPTDGSAWIGAPEPIEHVARGGAAYVIASRCTSGARFSQRANCGDPQPDDADEVSDDASDADSTSELADELKTRYLRGFKVFNGLRLACDPIIDDLATAISSLMSDHR